jgi:hypothetical protein
MAGVKEIVAGFRLRFHLRAYQASPICLPDDMRNTRNVMICLPPGQRELTMIKQLLPELARIFSDSEIYLLAAPGSPVYEIFPRKGYRILTPSSDQLTWSGLAKTAYINLLKQNRFDLILDLNLSPSHFVKSILLAFPRAIRAGAGGNLGIPYYNLEIKSGYLRDEKNIYRSIINMIAQLRENKSTKFDETAN